MGYVVGRLHKKDSVTEGEVCSRERVVMYHLVHEDEEKGPAPDSAGNRANCHPERSEGSLAFER